MRQPRNRKLIVSQENAGSFSANREWKVRNKIAFRQRGIFHKKIGILLTIW